jgi:hypothetical protein
MHKELALPFPQLGARRRLTGASSSAFTKYWG